METCVFLVYLSGSEYFFFREYFFIFKIRLISISTHKSRPHISLPFHHRIPVFCDPGSKILVRLYICTLVGTAPVQMRFGVPIL